VRWLLADARDAWIRWDWVADHTDDIRHRLWEHVELTVAAVAIGLLISLPLALLAARHRRVYLPILFVTGGLYTIPALALFGLLIPWTGLSRATALIPLVTYTLLILVRNIVTGLEGVPAEVREAAIGMGYSPLRRLVTIELPLAAPAVIAGIRIATVTTIGLVTITALVGQGGLGRFIIDGYTRDFRTPLVVGTALSVALAIVADVLLLGAQRLATPWQRRGR
jgi:osmoprotectant transport system permease protein